MSLDLPKNNMPKLQTMPGSRGERGSTILLVLAMLSILLLLGIAFSYSTRLESQASFNYAELSQARSSASSGLPMAVPMLAQASQGITSPLQNWSTVPNALKEIIKSNGKSNGVSAAQMAAMRQAGISLRKSESGAIQSAPQANLAVRDLSALVNLNAVDNEAIMQRVIQAVLPNDNVRQKSAALMMLRGDFPHSGGQPSRSAYGINDEPADLDPRDANTQMLDSLSRLRLGAQTGQPLFSEVEIEKLSTFVTVFSQAPEVFNGPEDVHVPRIPLDAIEPKRVYDTLRQAFPHKKNELLLQFAANITDFSDEDDEPTILDSSGNRITGLEDGADTSNLTIGVEMTPVISEVYPDAATSVGFDDDGQFVEITNPWSVPISLAGWTLRTGSGGSIQLSAQLPPNGMLLITDNFDTPSADSPPGYGSVVSLFGSTADGGTRQVMTQPSFDLVDRNSRVSLYDPNGQLVDVFVYESTGQVDGKLSFQRTDPLVRGSSSAQATPLMSGAGGLSNTSNMAAATKAWEEGNTTMTKVSQLFTLSTGFVERSETDAGNIGEKVHASQMAELKMPEDFVATQNVNGEPYPDNLDLRLIDIFTATPTPVKVDTELAEGARNSNNENRNAYEAFREKMDRLRNRNNNRAASSQETTVSTVFSYGKLNINTCPKYALLGLNLENVGAGKRGAAGMLEEFEGHRLRQIQQGKAPFRNVSDFVSQFTPNLSRQNLEKLDSITDQVAVGSSSFEVTATNRLSPEDQKALESNSSADGPRPATATAKWVISMDQEPYSVVSFSLVP